MKKYLYITLCLLILISLTGCTKEKNNLSTDAMKFKEEYESLNGTTSSSGKTIRTININKDNPIIYKTEEEIINMVENKETFVVYFGFASCPWCRSIINNLINASNDLKLDKIYYVDVLKIRDTMTIDDNNQIITETRGSTGYYQLLKIFDKVLSDYTLKNKNNETIKTGEKRIYAPNIISVVNGEVQTLTTGISDNQKYAYMELTESINKDSYNKIKCTIRCVSDAKNSCSSDKMC